MNHPPYIKDADPAGVELAYNFFKDFYSRYPTGKETGEALYQIRMDMGLVPKEEPKKSRKQVTPKDDEE